MFTCARAFRSEKSGAAREQPVAEASAVARRHVARDLDSGLKVEGII
jgi:hypothetical protein